MIYLICQDWTNTSNNHAGMKYLCMQLEQRYSGEYKTFVIPDLSSNSQKGGFFHKVYNYLLTKARHRIESRKIYRTLKQNLNYGDVVFIMEYLDKGLEMYSFAKLINKNHKGVKLFGMVHLVPKKIDMAFPSDCVLKSWVAPLDKLFTLGHSLTDYLTQRGIDKSKLETSFHYVDEFYMKDSVIRVNEPPIVLAMGNQVRNIPLLKKIVEENPSVSFTICQGLVDMTSIFHNNTNVRLIPFIPESELREIMNESDISLNVMEDTIGSNVIVTSLAMGLAMVCSDVGSIRDYCDDSDTLFCSNSESNSFSEAIKKLTNAKLLCTMKKHSVEQAKNFSISRFHNELKHIIDNCK